MPGAPTGHDNKSFWRGYWRLTEAAHGRLPRMIALIVIVQLCALAEPFLFKRIIDAISAGKVQTAGGLETMVATMAAVLIVIGGITAYKNHKVIDFVGIVEHVIPVVCGRKLLRLPLSFHQRDNTGLIIGKLVRGVGKTVELTGILMHEIIPLAFQILVALPIFLTFEWTAAIVMLPVIAIFAWLTTRIKTKMSKTRRERHDTNEDSDQALGQAVTNVMTVQAFIQEERETRLVGKLRDTVRRLLNEEYEAYARTDVLRNGIVSAGRAAVIYVVARAVTKGALTTGDLVFMATLSERIFISCYRIGAVFDRVMEAMEPVIHMNAILDEPETLADPEKPIPVPERFEGRIEFCAVTYSYTSAQADGVARPPVIKGLSFAINARETVGVVGPSGGGKTTFAKLIDRFDDPEGGAILIDGVDIRLYRKDDLRRQIGYVPQEVEIFDATVAENIAYGRPDATRAQIEAAARAASAHDFILETERGYDTRVGNRGLRLSGGQRQRIGIARALLLDPPILILDEATSHVDSLSEWAIHKAMAEFSKGRTVITIAHKLATVRDADRIVVIDGGRAVENGRHQELIAAGGLYHQLVELQTLDGQN